MFAFASNSAPRVGLLGVAGSFAEVAGLEAFLLVSEDEAALLIAMEVTGTMDTGAAVDADGMDGGDDDGIKPSLARSTFC